VTTVSGVANEECAYTAIQAQVGQSAKVDVMNVRALGFVLM
jgi:uncharacterized ParB-like nuclease family protein